MDAVKINLKNHPEAIRKIRRARSLGGLSGFMLIGLIGYLVSKASLEVILFRALVGGLAGYLLAWMISMLLWKNIVRLYHTPDLEVNDR